eukprot:TRINITY_DN1598_c1_g1_i2.p1 TRINITY_DN1598_c1_g1~~TRINITY_DN1598_c1_g1_i2.p1  ORF type:complete len:1007 (-),score=275.85 TRINITY_DN1598_c1_g1_i2:2-3022(-)
MAQQDCTLNEIERSLALKNPELLSPNEKKILQKKGNIIILKLSELFPSIELKVIVSVVKLCKLDIVKCTEKINQIQKVKDVVSFAEYSHIFKNLEKNKWDVEKVILQLLEDSADLLDDNDAPEPEPEPESEPKVTAQPKETTGVIDNVHNDKMAEGDDIDEDNNCDPCDEDEIGEADIDDTIDEYYFDDSDEEIDQEELDAWFVSPLDEYLSEKDKESEESQPDLLTKLYQEMADAEFAQQVLLSPPTKEEIMQRRIYDIYSGKYKESKEDDFDPSSLPSGIYTHYDTKKTVKSPQDRVAQRYRPTQADILSSQNKDKLNLATIHVNPDVEGFIHHVKTNVQVDKKAAKSPLEKFKLKNSSLQTLFKEVVQEYYQLKNLLKQFREQKEKEKKFKSESSNKKPTNSSPVVPKEYKTTEEKVADNNSNSSSTPVVDHQSYFVVDDVEDDFKVDFDISKLKNNLEKQDEIIQQLTSTIMGFDSSKHSLPKFLRLPVPAPVSISFPQPLDLSLTVELPPTFPDVPPKLGVISNEYDKQLSDKTIQTLVKFLNKKVLSVFKHNGSVDIEKVIEFAEKWLNTISMVKDDAATTLERKWNQDRDTKFLNYDFQTSSILQFFLDMPTKMLSTQHILKDREEVLCKFKESLKNQFEVHVSNTITYRIANHFEWDFKKFQKTLHDETYKGDPKSLIMDVIGEALVAIENNDKVFGIVKDANESESKTIECPSCLDDCQLDDIVALNCGHSYCRYCMKQYITLKIENSEADGMACPGYKCPNIVDNVIICSIINDDIDLYSKYVKFITNQYVDSSPYIKWCPSKSCGHAIQRINSTKGTVLCDNCKYLWCFSCQKDGHWPASCVQYKWWNDVYAKDQKIGFESEEEAASVKWLLKYTQDCPKCTSPIQKNGGCNHMSCKKCGYQYCWVCLDNWTGSHYSCTKTATSSNERDHILMRIEGNLSFRQYFVINLNAKRGTDEGLLLFSSLLLLYCVVVVVVIICIKYMSMMSSTNNFVDI